MLTVGFSPTQEAEEMHIKAIQIKEQLLGNEDYEVALSVGHLASLYNYDMNQYEDAERLYLRSIAIGQCSVWVRLSAPAWFRVLYEHVGLCGVGLGPGQANM